VSKEITFLDTDTVRFTSHGSRVINTELCWLDDPWSRLICDYGQTKETRNCQRSFSRYTRTHKQ